MWLIGRLAVGSWAKGMSSDVGEIVVPLTQSRQVGLPTVINILSNLTTSM